MSTSHLTEELLERLCETHAGGKDFRNMTAIRCGKPPKTLQMWLRVGAGDFEEGRNTLHSQLFQRFGVIEGEFRAKLIGEIADPTSKTEVHEFDDEGNTISRTITERRVSGLQWLLERRFNQWRMASSQAPREDECDVAELLVKQPGTGLTQEMAVAICQQLAQAMPPALLPVFLAAGWTPPARALPMRRSDDAAEPEEG